MSRCSCRWSPALRSSRRRARINSTPAQTSAARARLPATASTPGAEPRLVTTPRETGVLSTTQPTKSWAMGPRTRAICRISASSTATQRSRGSNIGSSERAHKARSSKIGSCASAFDQGRRRYRNRPRSRRFGVRPRFRCRRSSPIRPTAASQVSKHTSQARDQHRSPSTWRSAATTSSEPHDSITTRSASTVARRGSRITMCSPSKRRATTRSRSPRFGMALQR